MYHIYRICIFILLELESRIYGDYKFGYVAQLLSIDLNNPWQFINLVSTSNGYVSRYLSSDDGRQYSFTMWTTRTILRSTCVNIQVICIRCYIRLILLVNIIT